MEVRLKQEWLGHAIGDIIKVNNKNANYLLQGDFAEKMEPDNDITIREKLQRILSHKVKTSHG